MKNVKLAEIEACIERLAEIRETLAAIMDEEIDNYDSESEAFKNSEKGVLTDTAIASIDDACMSLDETADYLTEALCFFKEV